MGGQQKSNMTAQLGTNDNIGDTLHKNSQLKVHEMKAYELKQFFWYTVQ